MEIIINRENVYGQPILSYNDYIYKQSIEKNQYWEEHIVNKIIEHIQEDTDILDIGQI
jgi:hypothetical protein